MVGNVAAELSYVLPEDSSKSFKELFQKLEGMLVIVLYGFVAFCLLFFLRFEHPM